ncbi:MAG: hypothetical protein U1E95_08220 [Rubrivivax sp.]
MRLPLIDSGVAAATVVVPPALLFSVPVKVRGAPPLTLNCALLSTLAVIAPPGS